MNQIFEIQDSQFPFGKLESKEVDSRKMLVKRRYNFRNSHQKEITIQKITKLKVITHKNTINLRQAEIVDDYADLYYPYVPLNLEESFAESEATIKDLHKQFIQLIIYLAKNYVLTSFNPARCGLVTKEKKVMVKYYLPLKEIMITENISDLERSVQLFNVQSMHYLDTLSQNALNNTQDKSSVTSRSFSKRRKVEPKKGRRESQPIIFQYNQGRRLSTNPASNSQLRKLSTLSKELTEISELYKRKKKESKTSAGSFTTTIKKLLSLSSSTSINIDFKRKDIEQIKAKTLLSRQRSVNALKDFEILKERINDLEKVQNLIRSIKHN